MHACRYLNVWAYTVFDAPQFQQGKSRKKKKTTCIKRDEINIINIINDNTFNLHNRLLENNNRYMKVTLT